MSEKQYEVARKGVIVQLRTAQKLHCKHMEQKYKEALEKLQKRFLKPACRWLLRFGRKGIK